jgi:ribosomal-protein-alanine N-acetyltransferase
MSFPETFTTPRLIAERLTAAHRSELRRMHVDPVTMAFLGGLRTEEQTDDYLVKNLAHWDRYGFGLWILRSREEGADDEPVGRCVLRHAEIEGVDEIEVGYSFYPPHWGRGLATEIASACVAFARDELRLAGLVALTDPANAASQHVLRKVGLSYDRDVVWQGLPSSLFRLRWRPVAGD